MAKNNQPATYEQLLEDWGSYTPHLVKGEHMAGVVLSVGYIEKLLGALLAGFLIEGETSARMLDSLRGPIASLSSKNQLAYCLGLIPKSVFMAIQGLAEIRNLFAHSHVTLSLDDPEPLSRLNAIKLPPGLETKSDNGLSYVIYPANMIAGLPGEGSPSPTQRFTIAICFVMNILIYLVPRVQRRDRAFEGPGDATKIGTIKAD